MHYTKRYCGCQIIGLYHFTQGMLLGICTPEVLMTRLFSHYRFSAVNIEKKCLGFTFFSKNLIFNRKIVILLSIQSYLCVPVLCKKMFFH